MSFSYTLFLALMLIAPGLGLWAGLRIGERSELISQAPEKPGSTSNLFVIVFGALLGHILLSFLFVMQAVFCKGSGLCFSVGFDPNVYRAILINGRGTASASDFAFFSWFFALLLPSLITGYIGVEASKDAALRNLREASSFGWLKPFVDQASSPNAFIIAYVVTTLEHEGSNVAYQGIVENIALDDNRAIKMLVLSDCDRFLVRVSAFKVQRIDFDKTQIPVIQLEADNFINVALEVFEVSEDSNPPTGNAETD